MSFDCGPGNCLIDGWIRKQQNKAYDHNGQWGGQSSPDPQLLAYMLKHPFIGKRAPKSACVRDFSLDWLQDCLQICPPIEAVRVQATLTAFTAECIARAVCGRPARTTDLNTTVVLCGGGARNQTLINNIRECARVDAVSYTHLTLPTICSV